VHGAGVARFVPLPSKRFFFADAFFFCTFITMAFCFQHRISTHHVLKQTSKTPNAMYQQRLYTAYQTHHHIQTQDKAENEP
jgi:hypothetical protein